eukprot:6194703-Pleurochrysis_carterae.AAC.4
MQLRAILHLLRRAAPLARDAECASQAAGQLADGEQEERQGAPGLRSACPRSARAHLYFYLHVRPTPASSCTLVYASLLATLNRLGLATNSHGSGFSADVARFASAMEAKVRALNRTPYRGLVPRRAAFQQSMMTQAALLAEETTGPAPHRVRT